MGKTIGIILSLLIVAALIFFGVRSCTVENGVATNVGQHTVAGQCLAGDQLACQYYSAAMAVEEAQKVLEAAKRNLVEAEQAYRQNIAPPTVTSDGQ